MFVVDTFKLFAILLVASSTFSEHRASFSNESASSWDPFNYDPLCPRFLISDVGWNGFGDELEHYFYYVTVAQLLEATVVLQGGLVDGSKIGHNGGTEYPEIAKILGVPNSPHRNNITALTAVTGGGEKNGFTNVQISFADAMNIHKNAGSGSSGDGATSLSCNSIITSSVDSCHGGTWCTWIDGPGHHFVSNVRSLLVKNNTARNNCISQRRGFDVCSSASSPEMVLNVAWHIRTGDVNLHFDPAYFHTVLKYLRLALSPSSNSEGDTEDSNPPPSPSYRLQLVFEAQDRVEFLESTFPDAIFNIGRNISDTVCTFLTSDIFISSGSSFSLVMAFTSNRRPIIFEELRKEHFIPSYKKVVLSMSKKHMFSRQEAVLLEHGKPLQDMREVRQIVAAGLAERRAECGHST